MASTTVVIPGVEDIVVPFTMTIAQAIDFISADQPVISGMESSIVTTGEDVVITFRQKTGTKG